MKTYKNNLHKLNFGILNVRGCKTTFEKQILAEDAANYDIDILGISETHIKQEDFEEITVYKNNKKVEYQLFYTGNNSNHGVGLLLKKDLKAKVKTVSERICVANFAFGGRNCTVISAYAHTLAVSESKPELRETFYQQLDKTLKNIPKRNVCVVVGDFNAKTGSGHELYPNNIGKFGKGFINSSGAILLEHLAKHEMVITNTLFQHKMCHRTTWTAPNRNFITHDGTPRKNPIRNQIDYIITKCEHQIFVKDSRSYGGIKTSTDHKLVKTQMMFEWCKMKNTKKNKHISINIRNFSDKQKQKDYSTRLIQLHNEKKNELNEDKNISPQDRWNLIQEITKKAGEEILGTNEKKIRFHNNHLEQLSKEQHKIKLDIESNTDPTVKETLRKNRKQIQKQINNIVKKLEEQELDEKLKNMEKIKNDSNKAHEAIRQLKSLKKKKALLVKNEEGEILCNTEDQIEIISEHFKKMLAPTLHDENIKTFEPMELNQPFTISEIRKAVKSMKNGKSSGCDEMYSEYLKYAPDTIIEEITHILNETAKTGNFPKELRIGILTPLPKPGKKQGPPSNLRPIILLSILRKILAICVINRCWEKMSREIPRDQAAYQAGRSTTEQVFAIKILAEKAITSSNYKLYLLLLDMSKAFDTVNRAKLLKDLEGILEPDELHLMHILINSVELYVKINNITSSNPIHTNTGICQGDCLSAILFIYYLAKSLSPKTSTYDDHNYTKNPENKIEQHPYTEHNYSKYIENPFVIQPKYADDISWATTSEAIIKSVKNEIPEKLKERDLHINKEKTEEYLISRNDTSWKDCKLLGSMLETMKDIERRKSLLIHTMKELKYIFKSHRLNNSIKIRTFEAYASSIFLYNSELWTTTNTINKNIDGFHRRQLRYALNIIYPKEISTEELYKETKVEPWSIVILRRRMSWLGHLLRLPIETPARIALDEALKPSKKPRGHPKLTWITLIIKDLTNIGILKQETTEEIELLKNQRAIINQLCELTQDRKVWNNRVRSAITDWWKRT